MKIEHRTVGLFEENCYLVADEENGRAVLIDPGDEGARLLAMLSESRMTLDAIWLTHAHIDHIGAVAEICRHHDVPVYLHPLDLPWYTTLSELSAETYGIDFEQPDVPITELADGDVLHCGQLQFTVMHVPGHAPGLVSFNGHGVAFAGDLLYAGSIGRTDLTLGNPSAMNLSLDRFVSTLPAETIVYPGHGPRTTLSREQRTNPFLLALDRATRF